MPEWLTVTGTISVVVVAAGIVSGPSIMANHPAAAVIPNQPPSSFPVPAPRSMPAVPAPPPAPELLPPVQIPSPVPVRAPASTTAPARHAPVVVPPSVLDTLAPTTTTVPSDTVPPSEIPSPCPVGLVLDPVLGVCVSL